MPTHTSSHLITDWLIRPQPGSDWLAWCRAALWLVQSPGPARPDGHTRYDEQKWGIRNRFIVQSPDFKPFQFNIRTENQSKIGHRCPISIYNLFSLRHIEGFVSTSSLDSRRFQHLFSYIPFQCTLLIHCMCGCAIWCWWWWRAIWFSQLSLVSAARESGPGYVCGCYQFLDALDWKNDIGYITQCGDPGNRHQ